MDALTLRKLLRGAAHQCWERCSLVGVLKYLACQAIFTCRMSGQWELTQSLNFFARLCAMLHPTAPILVKVRAFHGFGGAQSWHNEWHQHTKRNGHHCQGSRKVLVHGFAFGFSSDFF